MRSPEKDEGSVDPTAATTEPPPAETPFQRFQEFARRVLSVPREEMEERERAYREGRKDKLRKVTGPP